MICAHSRLVAENGVPGGLRELSAAELMMVGGGFYDDGFGGSSSIGAAESGSGSYQVAGLFDWVAKNVAWEATVWVVTNLPSASSDLGYGALPATAYNSVNGSDKMSDTWIPEAGHGGF